MIRECRQSQRVKQGLSWQGEVLRLGYDSKNRLPRLGLSWKCTVVYLKTGVFA
jgi:hypothetical protein